MRVDNQTNKNTLILLGYWHSETEPCWPDPAWFVDLEWDHQQRNQVIEHLERGQCLAASPGLSWCRFQCESGFCGSSDLTDGRYLWPEGLVHYVREHFVRLPEPFVHHVLNHHPVEFEFAPDTVIQSEWWLAQQGWNQGATVLRPFNQGRIWVGAVHSKPSIEMIRFLRQFDGVALLGTVEILEKVRQRNTIILKHTACYGDFLKYRREAEKLGLHLEFEEIPA